MGMGLTSSALVPTTVGMRSVLALSIAFTITLFGCGTTVAFTNSGIPHRPMAARPAADVQIFSIAPQRPFVEVGMLVGRQESAASLDDEETVVAEMRARAGGIGCDGLIILGASNAFSAVDGRLTTLHGYRATCILFTDAKPGSMLKVGSGPIAPPPETKF